MLRLPSRIFLCEHKFRYLLIFALKIQIWRTENPLFILKTSDYPCNIAGSGTYVRLNSKSSLQIKNSGSSVRMKAFQEI